jgi:hypothetical protein
MRGAFVPLVALLLLPGAFVAWRLGLLRRPAARWAALALALAALVAVAPAEGFDFVYLKHMTLLLSAAAIVLVLLRHYGGRFAPGAAHYGGALAALAAASLTVYLNFFSFHGARTWVHLHDVAHYYLGAKYFDELGYEHLYTAMLRAEAELTPGRFATLEARDLSTNELVPIRELLLRSDEVKAGFTPERWEDWKRDVQLFRQALGPQFKTLYIDHGFNPTPLWPVLGGTLAGLVPAGSASGVLILTLLDPLLLAAAFAMVAWAFGRTAALLGVIEFCLVYGASFGWTGGAFLRYVWLFCVLAAACFLHRRRFAPAGALLAVAAALRVFPVLFAAPLGLQALVLAWRERRLPREHLRFFAALAGTGLALFLLTAAQGRGLGAWGEFRHNMSKHMDTVSPNIVGLTPVFAYQDLPEKITLEEMRAQREHYVRAGNVQKATLFLATLLAVALIAPRLRPDESMLLAVPLLLTGLNLASYYYVLLVLMVVVWWDRPLRLAGLFGLELATHALLLFEPREQFLYMYRSVLLLYLLIAFYARDLREAARELIAPRTDGQSGERAVG